MRSALDSPTAPEQPSGRRVVGGRYVLSEVLGRGGSATVYRAWDMRARRGVALKWFALGVDDPGSLRHRREPEMLARLDGPGLVALLDAGTHDGHTYLVMTLVDGPSLAARLAQGPLPLGEVGALGRRLAATLATVHAREVTHRDVKPANVLLDRERGPLLADFGIALLPDTTRVTATGTAVGTPAAMAPEQLRGEDVGPPADVYALGLLLIEALTGRSAFPGTGPEAVLARLHRSPTVPDAASGALGTLLRRMTDPLPGTRPTAAEVASALGAPGTTSAGAAVARRTPTPRHRRWLGLAATAAAAAAVALAVLLVGSVSPSPSVTLVPPVPGSATPLPATGPTLAGPGTGREPAAASAASPASAARSVPTGPTDARGGSGGSGGSAGHERDDGGGNGGSGRGRGGHGSDE